jgi:hypothetical protein
MKRGHYKFGEKISRDLEAHRAARKILGVEENADEKALKKAYRQASLQFHPDHNRNDSDAHKKFLLVKCAYRLLVEDEPCEILLDEIKSWRGAPEDDKYKLDNPWGHFLWWREKFFE